MPLYDNAIRQGLRIAEIAVKGTVANLAWLHVRAGATHMVSGMRGSDEAAWTRAQWLARNTGLAVMRMSAALSLDVDVPRLLRRSQCGWVKFFRREDALSMSPWD